MFEEMERMQHYYHQLIQTAEELALQAYRLRRQAEESLAGVHPNTFAEGMQSAADDTFRQLQQLSDHLFDQAAEVKKWLDQAALLIPLAPPPCSL